MVRGRDDLGNAEIQQTKFSARTDLYVGGLDVSVHNRRFSPLDIGEEGVQRAELSAHFRGVARRALGVETAFSLQKLGYALSFEVLHGNEEAALLLAEIVDFENARIDLVKLFLNLRAAPFGFDHQLRKLIARLLDD